MLEPPNRFMNSIHTQYPDDQRIKSVWLQAAGLDYPGFGDRHVLIWWENGPSTSNANSTSTDKNQECASQSADITQIIQLAGGPGNYHYYYPVVQKQKGGANLYAVQVESNQQWFLAEFTRGQRDRILELAAGLEFKKDSGVNGCRVWTRDHLEAMVEDGLLGVDVFEGVDREAPLVQRKAEI
ncbi:hypothetical protein BDN72DRAFT_844516 [Pluteus cervinus]|uniref:Uncharacterized protein n=1 Tax=Pluteus cervinus TaxID=181527 RepID=A0ACD3AL84_9AGAR|nr:hypothetical protein BDN72DRAFT_844516 [Pluteus cervinus]